MPTPTPRAGTQQQHPDQAAVPSIPWDEPVVRNMREVTPWLRH